MSYILDALKKADAERERGSVPGLHSRPQSPAPDDGDSPARQTVPLVWIGAGVAISVIALLSWQLLTRAAPPATQAMDNTAFQAPAPPLEQVDTPRPPEPPPYQQPVNPAVRTPPAAMAPPTPMAREASPPARNAIPDPARVAHAPSGNTSTGTNAPLSASAHIPTLNELPEELRRELPAMVIGGAMHSDTPSARMIVLNSQVIHEGEQPVPGLLLEEIRLKSAIFKYKGYRYVVNY